MSRNLSDDPTRIDPVTPPPSLVPCVIQLPEDLKRRGKAVRAEEGSGPTPRKKRKRNFTQKECELLMEHGSKRAIFLTSRSNPNITNKRKEAIWKDIAANLNEANGLGDRNWRECRTKWQNVLSSAKMKARNIKVSRSLTGGVCFKEEPLNAFEYTALMGIGEAEQLQG